MEWKKPKSDDWGGYETPYVHWWKKKEVPNYQDDYSDVLAPGYERRPGETLFSIPVPKSAANTSFVTSSPEDTSNRPSTWQSADHDAVFTTGIVREGQEGPILKRDDVIIGIIDVGIALGHRRFRRRDGTTRFLAAWQQTSAPLKDNAEPPNYEQPYLPFGRELYTSDIDKLLRAHTDGGLENGWLDEEAFNMACSLVEPMDKFGYRELEHSGTHGAHVLDLAAGYDPKSPYAAEDARMEQIHLMAVNLPPQYVHGSAGNFLSLFAGNAVERILFLADELWKRDYDGEKGGFPLVINFSFGKHAGPKDGGSLWEKLVRDKIEKREKSTGAVTRLVMPAGNKNLSRGHARASVGNGDVKRKEWKTRYGTVAPKRRYPANDSLLVPWRILPTDHTPNHVEVWPRAQNREKWAALKEAASTDYALSVVPPGYAKVFAAETRGVDAKDADIAVRLEVLGRFEVPALEPGQYADLGDFARVYCYDPTRVFYKKHGKEVREDTDTEPQTKSYEFATSTESDEAERPHFVICVAPTAALDPSHTEAPAGLWHISFKLRSNSEAEAREDVVFETSMMVQTDQSGIRHARTGLPSYFDHPNYVTHDEDTGRLLDSYAPGPTRIRSGDNLEPYYRSGPVQRKGTQNALATRNSGCMIVIGGYRSSDGKPSIFSSTFDGRKSRLGGREVPSVIYPTDDTPSHFGLMAAGAKEGSVTMLQGTSMATALATRDLALAILDWTRNPAAFEGAPDEKWLRKQADNHRDAVTEPFSHLSGQKKKERQRKNEVALRYNALKQGAGRVPMPNTGRIDRLEQD